MKPIRHVCLVGDDVAVATLSNGEEVFLASEIRNGERYFKRRVGKNKIYPVGTRMSGVQFSEKTTWSVK